MLILWTILQSFSFIPLLAFEELIFYFFCKFNLSAAIATNQIERFGLKWYAWLEGGPFNKHFCKTLVKISAMR